MTISFTFLLDLGFKGIVLNQALPSLHEGSFGITLYKCHFKRIEYPTQIVLFSNPKQKLLQPDVANLWFFKFLTLD